MPSMRRFVSFCGGSRRGAPRPASRVASWKRGRASIRSASEEEKETEKEENEDEEEEEEREFSLKGIGEGLGESAFGTANETFAARSTRAPSARNPSTTNVAVPRSSHLSKKSLSFSFSPFLSMSGFPSTSNDTSTTRSRSFHAHARNPAMPSGSPGCASRARSAARVLSSASRYRSSRCIHGMNSALSRASDAFWKSQTPSATEAATAATAQPLRRDIYAVAFARPGWTAAMKRSPGFSRSARSRCHLLWKRASGRPSRSTRQATL